MKPPFVSPRNVRAVVRVDRLARRANRLERLPLTRYRRLALDGLEVLLGTSAVGNERVTFELAGPDDLWLHARGVPGSHVVVRSGGGAVPTDVVEAAAQLAARHSTAQADALVMVDWTPRRYVRKIRGAPPGLVTYTHEQTLRVRPDAGPTPE